MSGVILVTWYYQYSAYDFPFCCLIELLTFRSHVLVIWCYLYSVLCCVLQAIEHTFHRRTMLVAESINHIVQFLSFKALNAIATAKVRHMLRASCLPLPLLD